jgi:serine protease Do
MEESGPGVILDRQGHVLAAHFEPPSFGFGGDATTPAMEEIKIRLPDGATVEGEYLGQDPVTRLAILKFDPAGLTFQPLATGRGGSIGLGDPVMVVGRLPASLGSGMTFRMTRINGEVGGVYLTQESLDDMISAPVYSERGVLVGFVGPYRAEGQEDQRQGFSFRSIMRVVQGRGGGEFTARGVLIPLDSLSELLADPAAVSQRTALGWHGLEVRPVTDQYRSFYGGLDDYPGCVTVASVAPDSPGAAVDLRPADILLRVDDTVVDARAPGGFDQLFAGKQPGDEVVITGLRDGEPITFTLTLAPAPPTWSTAPGARDAGLGLAVKQLTPDYVKDRRLPEGLTGVVVTEVVAESAAAAAGLKEGDIITEAGGRPVESLAVFKRALDAGGTTLELQYVRNGKQARASLER